MGYIPRRTVPQLVGSSSLFWKKTLFWPPYVYCYVLLRMKN